MQTYPTTARSTDIVRTFMARTYSWMAAGLALTAGIAWLTASNEALAQQARQSEAWRQCDQQRLRLEAEVGVIQASRSWRWCSC